MKKALVGYGGYTREVLAQMVPKNIIRIWNYHIPTCHNLRCTKDETI